MGNSGNETKAGSYEVVQVHFFYVVLILVGVLILMATRNWTKLDGFTEYLSVAATITSLVLGILAIIYSFVTSNSTNSFLGSVESSAKEMKSVGSDLQVVLSKGQELQIHAQQRNEELHSLIDSLRGTVEDLTKNTSSIVGTVESIPGKIESLREEFRARVKSDGPSTASVMLNANQVQPFLKQASVLGLTAMKAMVDAKIAQRHCDFKVIFQSEHSNSCEYVHGFLICASCFVLLDFTIDHRTYIAKDIEIPDSIAKQIQDEWNARMSGGSESTKNSLIKYSKLIPLSLLPVEAGSSENVQGV